MALRDIDINFDVQIDSGGKDPDSARKTLKSYHQLLWSKPLPNGQNMQLDIYRGFLKWNDKFCYDGLNHPTSVSTPEGFALMLLLDKIIGKGELIHYGQLEKVSSTFISLLDLIPYISECSESLGARYSLFLPTIIGKKKPEVEVTYRKLIYNLCKAIVEVDGLISISEKEWLNEIALLNDDDPTNDLNVTDL